MHARTLISLLALPVLLLALPLAHAQQDAPEQHAPPVRQAAPARPAPPARPRARDHRPGRMQGREMQRRREFRHLSPQERQRVLRSWQHFQSLPPERRDALRRQWREQREGAAALRRHHRDEPAPTRAPADARPPEPA